MSTPGDMVIELNFVPEWARRPADQRAYAQFEDRPRGRGRDRDRDRDGGRDQDGRQPVKKSGYADQRRPRPEANPKKHGNLGPPRSFRTASLRSPSAIDRRQEHPDDRLPPVKVTFIHERRGLKPLVARLARSGRAYPLFEVATLFLSKPDFYAVKQEVIPGAESVSLYQCAE